MPHADGSRSRPSMSSPRRRAQPVAARKISAGRRTSRTTRPVVASAIGMTRYRAPDQPQPAQQRRHRDGPSVQEESADAEGAAASPPRQLMLMNRSEQRDVSRAPGRSETMRPCRRAGRADGRSRRRAAGPRRPARSRPAPAPAAGPPRPPPRPGAAARGDRSQTTSPSSAPTSSDAAHDPALGPCPEPGSPPRSPARRPGATEPMIARMSAADGTPETAWTRWVPRRTLASPDGVGRAEDRRGEQRQTAAPGEERGQRHQPQGQLDDFHDRGRVERTVPHDSGWSAGTGRWAPPDRPPAGHSSCSASMPEGPVSHRRLRGWVTRSAHAGRSYGRRDQLVLGA